MQPIDVSVNSKFHEVESVGVTEAVALVPVKTNTMITISSYGKRKIDIKKSIHISLFFLLFQRYLCVDSKKNLDICNLFKQLRNRS